MDRDQNFIGYTPSEAAKKKVTAAATQGLVIHKLVPFSVTILLNVYIFFFNFHFI
jgi:hypothetical protein